MNEVYQPAEDSHLLSEVLKNEKIFPTMKILDIGSGTGIQTQTILDSGALPKNITLTDINPKAIKFLKKKFSKSKVVNSNLFQNLKGKFDLIIFNPPYLPEDSREPKDSKTATTGGKKGSEIINKFLTQAKKYLTNNGKILLLTSSLTRGINWLDYKKKFVAKKKLFYEELRVHVLKIK